MPRTLRRAAAVLVLPAVVAVGGIAGCSSPATSAGSGQMSAICVPIGDPGVAGKWGPVYECAAKSVLDGRTATVAYSLASGGVIKQADTWINMQTYKPLTADDLSAYGLKAGDATVRPPTGPGCLYDGTRLCCVGPDHEDGVLYAKVAGAEQYRLVPPAQGSAPAGLPATLTASDAKAFFAGYTIWKLDSRAMSADPFADASPSATG